MKTLFRNILKIYNLLYIIGIINGLDYDNNEKSIGLRGAPGRDAILPSGLLVEIVMKADIDLNLHQLKRVAYPLTSDSGVPKSYVDNGRTIIPDIFLKLDGSSSMKDDLDLNDKRIIYLGTAISNSDAISMGQTNDLIANREANLINRNGDTFFGDIDMRRNRILNLNLPIVENEPATKKYTDDNFVLKSGDYMHGPLNMAGSGIYHGTRLALASELGPSWIQFMKLPSKYGK